MSTVSIQVTQGQFPTLFGGFGFHNSEAMFYRLIGKEQFDQKIGKCYRELSPGFMRTFGGYWNWSKENMDAFADYYERMQKVTDTPIYLACAKGKLHFTDEERAEYAEGVAKNLDYLINVRGVKQIRYYCYSNEMAMNDWGGLLKDLPLFKRYHELLYQAFTRHNLNIGLLATDASGSANWDTLDYAIANMKQITEDFCLHEYIGRFPLNSPELYPWFFKICREAVMKSIRCDNKRLILGEMGVRFMVDDGEGHKKQLDYEYLPGVVKDVNAFNYHGHSAEGALMYAEAAFAAINAGVFAISVWTFSDYPDPYVCHYAEHDPYAKAWGECEQFISQTQDTKYNKCGLIKWEDDGDYSVRDTYWGLGLISRFARRNSKVLDLACEDDSLRLLGIRNKDGSVSVFVLSRHDEPTEVRIGIDVKHADKLPPFHVYEFAVDNVPRNEFGDLQEASATLPLTDGALTFTVQPHSLTVFSTDYVIREPVAAGDVAVKGDRLCWNPVSDPLHCYYRVYRGTTPDFTPSPENQIASTIATDLEFNAPYLDDAAIRTVPGEYYKVLSVHQRR